MTPPVYLDYNANASTPVAPEVVEGVLHSMVARYGNPSSSYSLEREAHETVEDARAAVAEPIGTAGSDEVRFTGCATEANNLALPGVARKLQPAKRHLVVSAIEHPAVLEPALQLKREGWTLTVVPVDGLGGVSAAYVQAALRPATALVSIMHATTRSGRSSRSGKSRTSQDETESCCAPTQRSPSARSRSMSKRSASVS